MTVHEVDFYSHGTRLRGTLRFPQHRTNPVPAVIQGPGWLGLRDAQLYRPYHDGLVAAGIAVFCLDYRGFGDSDGDSTLIDPMAQVSDIRSAIDYLESRPEIDFTRLGLFGSGGTGGGNAIIAGALDKRVNAVVSQVPIANGTRWLRQMRREHEWLEFLERLRRDRVARATAGESELVHVHGEIVLPTPRRASTGHKKDVNDRVPTLVQLASADAIMEYRPMDYVGRIAPRALMLICVEDDEATPEDHAYDLYRKARSPKRLVVQRQTTHYEAYAQFREQVRPLIVDWFLERMQRRPHFLERSADAGVISLTPAAGRPDA